jgi:hypothetical protein
MMIDSHKNLNTKIEKEDKDANKIDINIACAHIVDFILKAAMTRKSFDNVSCVIISFKDLLFVPQNKNINLQIKNNEMKDEKFIKFLKENNGKLPKIINYSKTNIQDNEFNKPIRIPKKIFEEKTQNKSIEKEEDKNEHQITESNISKNSLNQNISPKKYIFNEFKNKTLDNNIKKLSLSTKRAKNNENITYNNSNNYLSNNQKEISEYNLLKYNSNNRNESKGKNRFNTVKKFNCGERKPKIINNDKNKFLKNLQLKIINNNSSFRKYSGDEPLSNGKDKITFSNNSSRLTTVTTANSKQLNNKYKINLNYILSPKNNSNNYGLELKYMNKKSNSFYNNNIMNSLKLKIDSNLYKKNINSKISQFDMMNCNSNNEMNLDNNIKKEKESIIKFRVSSEDRIKSYYDKTIIHNSINQNCNILNNTTNLNNQRFALNKRIEKKLITNLKEDISSRKNRFIFPTLNIKIKQNESTKKSN